jgi:hypothetical protein
VKGENRTTIIAYNSDRLNVQHALSTKKNYLPIPSCSLSNLAISATYSILTLQAA